MSRLNQMTLWLAKNWMSVLAAVLLGLSLSGLCFLWWISSTYRCRMGRHLRPLLLAGAEALNEAGWDWTLTYGTLLGAVRGREGHGLRV